jgi:hypothetical protein
MGWPLTISRRHLVNRHYAGACVRTPTSRVWPASGEWSDGGYCRRQPIRMFSDCNTHVTSTKIPSNIADDLWWMPQG